jgi:hypothetical protein
MITHGRSVLAAVAVIAAITSFVLWGNQVTRRGGSKPVWQPCLVRSAICFFLAQVTAVSAYGFFIAVGAVEFAAGRAVLGARTLRSRRSD